MNTQEAFRPAVIPGGFIRKQNGRAVRAPFSLRAGLKPGRECLSNSALHASAL